MTVDGDQGGLRAMYRGSDTPEQEFLVETRAREGEGPVDDIRTSVDYLRKQLE